MASINDITKHFKIFCEMCGGKYDETLLPQCVKSRFTITLDVVGGDTQIIKLLVKIISVEGDEEAFQLNNTRLVDVQRISENDHTGAIRYYTLNILTESGELSLKKDLKDNKLILSFKNSDITYVSTVIF